jgi:hypothetical protein
MARPLSEQLADLSVRAKGETRCLLVPRLSIS